MNPEQFSFLESLLNTPSPSGYERPIQDLVRAFVGEFADEVNTDWHGNVIAAVNPEGTPRILLDAHCDQIGLLVKHIDDKGFIRVSPIGGWDVQMLLGQKLQIWTSDGPITGVIARKAIHLLKPDERKQVPEVKDLWIDVGANSGDEVRERVQLGDPVTLELGLRRLLNDRAAAVGMDDRVGVWVVLEALRQVAEARPKAAVFAVSSVQEEIGLRGVTTSAFTVDPQIGIAVDVTHATDCPTIDEGEHGRIQVGGGAVVVRGPNANPTVFSRLMSAAQTHDIPVQVNALSKPASNDGNAMQVSRGGVATGIVAIPNRYMHSPVEVISFDDLTNAATLIAHFCLGIDETADFTP